MKRDAAPAARMDATVRQKTLRLLSNGVYVLTARHRGDFGAATVTWVSQASFRPPLLMAALRRSSSVFRCMAASGWAVLHIVGDGQTEIARRFFRPTRAEPGALNGEPVAERAAGPVLPRLPAHVECRVERVVDTGGDHAVVILEAVEAQCREPHPRPLTLAGTPWQYGG